MATSEAQLFNLALIACGQRDLLDDAASEDSAAAALCRVLFPAVRDALLERFAWSFATTNVALAALSGAERKGWAFAYGLPSDCLAVRSLWAGVREPPADIVPPHSIEHDETAGRVLLTDVEAAELKYTKRIEDVGRFTPLFGTALADAIAARLAAGLPVKPALAQGLEVKAERSFLLAATSELNQRRKDQPPQAAHIRARE